MKVDALTEINETLKKIEKQLKIQTGIYLPEQAAEILGIELEELERWMSEGIIAYSKVENQIYFSLHDIQKLMDKCHYYASKFNTTEFLA